MRLPFLNAPQTLHSDLVSWVSVPVSLGVPLQMLTMCSYSSAWVGHWSIRLTMNVRESCSGKLLLQCLSDFQWDSVTLNNITPLLSIMSFTAKA